MTLIAYHGNGIPRVLNRVCYEALSAGYTEMKDKVDPESVKKALVKMEWRNKSIVASPKQQVTGYRLQAAGCRPVICELWPVTGDL